MRATKQIPQVHNVDLRSDISMTQSYRDCVTHSQYVVIKLLAVLLHRKYM